LFNSVFTFNWETYLYKCTATFRTHCIILPTNVLTSYTHSYSFSGWSHTTYIYLLHTRTNHNKILKCILNRNIRFKLHIFKLCVLYLCIFFMNFCMISFSPFLQLMSLKMTTWVAKTCRRYTVFIIYLIHVCAFVVFSYHI
jgi:hypothetical protein